MKHILFYTVFLCSILQCAGQLSDNFNDNELDDAPQWYCDSSTFIVVDGVLKSNVSVLNISFSISTEVEIADTFVWLLNCKLAFNTSSLNYVDFVLFSDSTRFSKAKSLLSLRMGGSADEISLYNIKNGSETKLIDGADGFLNSSSSQFDIKIQYKNDSISIQYKKLGSTNYTDGGKVYYVFSASDGYTGITVKQSTSSFFNKHFFDDFYAGRPVVDTIKPTCDSLIVLTGNTLVSYMNETCNANDLKNKTNYLLSNSINPDSISVNENSTIVSLFFKDSFLNNTILDLQINGIKDLASNTMKSTKLNFIRYRTESPQYRDIIINEMMIDPEPSAGLPEKEYIELLNVSDKFLQLKGCKIQDPVTSLSLQEYVLAPDSFLVLYKIPSLNNSADQMVLRNADNTIIDEVSYTNEWYRDEQRMDGGFSLERIDITQFCLGEMNWKASVSNIGGTPVKTNAVAAKLPIDTSAPILIEYRTLNDTILILTFDENVYFTSSLQWFINGQQYTLKTNYADLDLKNIKVVMPYKFSAYSIYSIRFSGLNDCNGNIQFGTELRIQWPVMSKRNDIIINEILFNPKSGGVDFIELLNISNKAFDLSKLFIADLDEGGNLKNIYPISKSYSIATPGDFVLLTSDTNILCSGHNCGIKNCIKLQLPKMPSMPDDEGKLALLNLLSETVDSVHYSSDWHFSMLSDKNGVSLERIHAHAPSNDKHNWFSASSMSGFATPGFKNSNQSIPLHTEKYFSLQSKSLSPDMDGHEDLMILRYQLPKADYLSTIKIYDVQGKEILTLVDHKTLGTEGVIHWDGCSENGVMQSTGIYVVLIECLHPDGSIIREKMGVVLAVRF